MSPTVPPTSTLNIDCVGVEGCAALDKFLDFISHAEQSRTVQVVAWRSFKHAFVGSLGRAVVGFAHADKRS
jgi:hypothetical protein